MNTGYESSDSQEQAASVNSYEVNLELFLESIRAIGQEGWSFLGSDCDTARRKTLRTC